MALIDKIGTIALGSVTVAGASALYSYSTSKEEEKKIDEPKRERVIVEWKQAKKKSSYQKCITGEKPKPASVCGWLYNGLKNTPQ